MSNLTEEERKEIAYAIAQKRTEDDRDPTEIIEQDYNGDTDAYLCVMAGWHNVPIGAERALQRIIFILSDYSSILVSASIVHAINGHLDQQDMAELITKLRELAKTVQEKGQEELAALKDQNNKTHMLKGAMMCFLEDKQYLESKDVIESAVKSRCAQINQVIAILKQQ